MPGPPLALRRDALPKDKEPKQRLELRAIMVVASFAMINKAGLMKIISAGEDQSKDSKRHA